VSLQKFKLVFEGFFKHCVRFTAKDKYDVVFDLDRAIWKCSCTNGDFKAMQAKSGNCKHVRAARNVLKGLKNG
jgi:hypothetical protein